MRDITLNVYEMPWEFVPREEATDDYPAIHDYNSFMAAYVPTAERALREYWEDFQTDNHRRE